MEKLGFKKHYEEIYAQISASSIFKADDPWLRLEAEERFRLVVEEVTFICKCHSNLRILDLGCAEGWFFGYIVSKISFSVYVGSDIALINLEKARKNGLQDLVLCDAEHLPFRNNSFDLVLCTEVLEHLIKPKSALIEIARVSRKAIITTPLLGCPLFLDHVIFNKIAKIWSERLRESFHKFGVKAVLDFLYYDKGASHINQFTLSILKNYITDHFDVTKYRGIAFRFHGIRHILYGIPSFAILHKKLQYKLFDHILIFNCGLLGNTILLIVLETRSGTSQFACVH